MRQGAPFPTAHLCSPRVSCHRSASGGRRNLHSSAHFHKGTFYKKYSAKVFILILHLIIILKLSAVVMGKLIPYPPSSLYFSFFGCFFFVVFFFANLQWVIFWPCSLLRMFNEDQCIVQRQMCADSLLECQCKVLHTNRDPGEYYHSTYSYFVSFFITAP